MIKIPPFIQQLKPYKAGLSIEQLAREKNLTRIVKLASAENPLGPSPMAMKAINSSLTGLHRYTDPSSYNLVQAIAKKYGIQPNHIICGHGTDSLLAYIVSAFTTEDDEIITSEGTFIGMYVSIRKMGRKLIQVPMNNHGFNLDGILKAINEKTMMIYIANPNNPTGTMIDRKTFESFMDQVPNHIMVVLDEAYTAYASENESYPNGVAYDYPNMVVTRTFSKVYGLAGLRVGFAVGPDHVIEALYKVKLPFEPNNLAQAAAIAALDDEAFLKQTIELNKQSLNILYKCFDDLGIEYVRSHTNFILMLMPTEKFAEEFASGCLNRGLIVRHVDTFGIPQGIRINSGTIEETEFAVEVITKEYQKLIDKLKHPVA
ncbi:histidinol-phosphate transaminase [Marinoscillum sp. MHG1-6]|uniref:histidinol-phosphate transaminase n=1 Tax=Marinoscillum sp. MHG1-6 TaxID=2959627 RepID=UPI0021588B3C|nr:histidinol-phosphate transaminase [Marinoscillum sp. MHG1-6]